jgi:hypothetical protein
VDYSWITAIIAAIVAVIAFLQWVTAREKIVLDLFEKRFAVYEELRSAISYQIRHARTDDEHYLKFARAVSRSKLLFGPEVFSVLEERRIDLARVTLPKADNLGQVPESTQKRAEDVHVARLDRLGNFFDELDALVLPYMQHTQKKPEWANVLGSLVG